MMGTLAIIVSRQFELHDLQKLCRAGRLEHTSFHLLLHRDLL